MKSSLLMHILDGVGEVFDDDDLVENYVGDMPSDVLGEKKQIDVWFTIRSSINVIAVAVAKGIRTVVICKAEVIPTQILESAKHNGINIIITKFNTYDCIAKILSAGGQNAKI